MIQFVISFLSFAVYFLSHPAKLLAQACPAAKGGPGVTTALGCVPTDTQQLAGWILLNAIKVGGGIAFLLMLFGAFQILTSTGDPQKLKSGSETITNALTGLIFIIFSLFLLNLIGVKIFNLPEL